MRVNTKPIENFSVCIRLFQYKRSGKEKLILRSLFYLAEGEASKVPAVVKVLLITLTL